MEAILIKLLSKLEALNCEKNALLNAPSVKKDKLLGLTWGQQLLHCLLC